MPPCAARDSYGSAGLALITSGNSGYRRTCGSHSVTAYPRWKLYVGSVHDVAVPTSSTGACPLVKTPPHDKRFVCGKAYNSGLGGANSKSGAGVRHNVDVHELLAETHPLFAQAYRVYEFEDEGGRRLKHRSLLVCQWFHLNAEFTGFTTTASASCCVRPIGG